MVAAPIQCDVDGIPKGSHFLSARELLDGRMRFWDAQLAPAEIPQRLFGTLPGATGLRMGG